MSKSLILAGAAAASLIAGAAFAQDATTDSQLRRGGQDLPSATRSSEDALTAATNDDRTVAQTPGANVVSSTTTTDASGATLTTELISNGPVPDTPQNRARYGQPMSHAGRATAPRGN